MGCPNLLRWRLQNSNFLRQLYQMTSFSPPKIQTESDWLPSNVGIIISQIPWSAREILWDLLSCLPCKAREETFSKISKFWKFIFFYASHSLWLALFCSNEKLVNLRDFDCLAGNSNPKRCSIDRSIFLPARKQFPAVFVCDHNANLSGWNLTGRSDVSHDQETPTNMIIWVWLAISKVITIVLSLTIGHVCTWIIGHQQRKRSCLVCGYFRSWLRVKLMASRLNAPEYSDLTDKWHFKFVLFT